MWDEVLPIDQNGIITLYEVMYMPLEDFGGTIGTDLVNVTYPYKSVVLINLEEFVFYSITVRAYTLHGPGNYSSPLIIKTNEDGKIQTSYT